MTKKTYKDLIVWQKSFKLASHIYRLTDSFPPIERYGLYQQIRKSAVSVPSNIAEGYGRKHKTEFSQFLSIAYGSLLELETQYLLSIELGFSKNSDDIEGLIREVGSMLYVMIHKTTSPHSVLRTNTPRHHQFSRAAMPLLPYRVCMTPSPDTQPIGV